MNKERVCVTGANGYVATFIVKLLLESGYIVRGTVRDPDSERVQFLKQLVPLGIENLEIVKLGDITKQEDYDGVFDDCKYVMHVASSIFGDNAIESATKGTECACKAALKAGVKRLVLTATMASVCGDQVKNNPNHVWTEVDFNDNPGSDYSKGKTAGEKVAWDFVKQHPEFEVVTIHPALVLGPVYTTSPTSTVKFAALDVVNCAYTSENFPQNVFGIVDGRNVAEAHLKAMNTPEAKNQRYLCANAPQYSVAIIRDMILKQFPIFNIPEPAKRPSVREVSTDPSKVIKLLDHSLIPPEQSVHDTIISFLKLGLITKQPIENLPEDIKKEVENFK